MREYVRDIERYPILTEGEEKQVTRRMMGGEDEEVREEARRTLVQANLRYVIKIAKRYRGRGLGLEDLVSEGNVGLIRATHKFDPEKGCRFLTPATYWIHWEIGRAVVDRRSVVRVSTTTTKILTNWRRAERQFFLERGRMPTFEEVADRLGLSENQRDITRAAFRSDAVRNEDDENYPLHAVEGTSDDPAHNAYLSEIRECALRRSDRLRPREREVLFRKCGFGGHAEQHYSEMAQEKNVSTEAFGRIGREAARKLKDCMAAFDPHADLVY